MNNNRPSRSFRQYEEYDEDFSNVYSNTAYRSSGDGREGPYESNQRWAATDSISSSRTPGVRKSVTEASTRASTQRAAANINSASRNSASASKSKTGTNSSSTTSKVYRDTNIWGLLEKSYRTQDDPTSSNIPKLYFDGTPSDPYNYQEAVEITSSSGGSRHTSYLKQLEDYLLEKDMDIEEQMNKDKSDRMRGRSSLSSSSSKPIAGRGSVTSTRPQTGSKRPTVNSSSSFEFDGNHLNTIREIPRKSNANLEKIGEMTLEELAQLPLDLSDNSHLDIIDSEINAFYQSGYDQPKRSMGSSARKSTAVPPKTSTKARAIVEPSISLPSRRPPEPPKPKVAPKAKFEPKEESEPEDESESYVEPPQPPPDRNPELSQAKSSLSLLKSKIKQVNHVTSRAIRKNDSNVEASYPVGEPITRNNEAETALDEEEEDDDVFSPKNTQIRSTNTEGTNRPVARIPMPTGSKYVQPTSSKTPTRTYPLPEEDEHEDDAALQNQRKPQSLQDMLKQKNQVSPPPFSASKNANIRPPYQSEEDDDYPSKQINRQSDPRKKEVTSSYSSNPYEQDEFEDEEGEDVEQPTEECPDCGRKFIPTAFQKHVKICQKVFMQKRKKFDMTKQRLVGEGVDPELKKVYEKAKKEEMKAKRSGGAGGQGKNDSAQDSKWKQQSSAFRDAMRAAREYAKAKERGEEPPPPAISAPDPSLIPCPNCGRRFNEMAANRHIPQCKNIKAKPTALKRGGGINASAGLPAKSRTGRF